VEGGVTTIRDIIMCVEQLSGHSLNRDEGVKYGPSDCELEGATLCWMATPDAIRAAGMRGHNLLIGHESLYFPYNAPDAVDLPADWEMWHVNRRRRALLAGYGLAFLRLHGSLDEICIFDTFAKLLGLGEPVCADGLVKVYEIEPRPLGDLLAAVKDSLGMQAVRISDVEGMNQIVHRVGLPWGGLGLFVNVAYQQALVAQDCDVFIAGESDNYGFRFAHEVGIPMIETSHEISENPGLRVFADMLHNTFPDLELEFFENPCIWQMG
jgi:putative NIF3 family GTP cyclohydrolase 1 type 2